ncbi:hypothetical protein [Aestuariivirga sp.]|uniref:hypothetical protein n=1 Tax=Aestuariivirga sp. TaxID=2650926 RepID=UPI00301A169A
MRTSDVEGVRLVSWPEEASDQQRPDRRLVQSSFGDCQIGSTVSIEIARCKRGAPGKNVSGIINRACSGQTLEAQTIGVENHNRHQPVATAPHYDVAQAIAVDIGNLLDSSVSGFWNARLRSKTGSGGKIRLESRRFVLQKIRFSVTVEVANPWNILYFDACGLTLMPVDIPVDERIPPFLLGENNASFSKGIVAEAITVEISCFAFRKISCFAIRTFKTRKERGHKEGRTVQCLPSNS